MTPHELRLYNAALGNIGVGAIPSLDHEGERTLLCRANYERAVKYVTGLYNWNCTQKKAVLTAKAVTPPFGFSTAFQLPADLVRLEEIEGLSTGDYEIVGREIHADQATLNITYSRYISDPSEFSIHVSELISYALASYIAPTLKTVNEGQAAMEKVVQSMATAVAIDSDQVTNNLEEEDEWIGAYE